MNGGNGTTRHPRSEAAAHRLPAADREIPPQRGNQRPPRVGWSGFAGFRLRTRPAISTDRTACTAANLFPDDPRSDRILMNNNRQLFLASFFTLIAAGVGVRDPRGDP